ncbi:MFS transporter [Streptomyces indicus]|uniref:Predicted arabinose efflux permease, MFS family n=1 Tax=Streptomyces indicus TaxID=417292 RepID=A0A1G9EIH0_9ACTN|nr:MFS transporter [Streptomyces indicus]SDK75888.1 Predicted arabinose efflux permease, MFS family [Streptomyces indicus]
MPHPLRTLNFRLFFVGRSLSLIGDAVIPAALALAVLEISSSPSAMALVLACAMVPKLVLLPFGGVAGDWFHARTVALTTDGVRAASQLFVAVELLAGDPQLWQIAVAEAIGGAASAFALPTVAPLTTGTVEPDQLHRANAALGIVHSSARFGGPALAGLLVYLAGPGLAFLLDGVSFAVSALLLACTRVRKVPVERRALRADLVAGWREVRSRDWYWVSLVGHSAWNGAAAVLMTIGPALAVREFGGETAWVVLLQVGAAGLLLGSLLAARARPRRPILTANLGLATYALPLGLFAAGAPAPLVIGAYGIAQAGLGFLSPVWETAVQQAIPPHALARVVSYDWLLSLGAMPLGYALAPLAAGLWGADAPLWIAAGVVAVACAGTALVPGVRDFRARTPERAPVAEPVT